MYDTLRNRILAGGVPLAQIQYKIKKLYAMGSLTELETDALMALSQQHAATDAERPEILLLLQQLSRRVAALENQNTDADAPQAEYPVWTPWDGISSLYQKGAVVSHNGGLWQSVFEGQNVWEPGAAGTESLWASYSPEGA